MSRNRALARLIVKPTLNLILRNRPPRQENRRTHMRQDVIGIFRAPLTAWLMLAALSVSLLTAPNTLADSGPKHAPASPCAYNPHGPAPWDWLAENSLWRGPKHTPDGTHASPLTPALAPRAPAQSSCAPQSYCLFMGCWYELLNNGGFEEDASCQPNWVFPAGSAPSSSTICNSMPYPVYSKVVVLPAASGLYQNFGVPEDVSRPLQLAIHFAAVGTPGSSDRIIIELRESGVLLERRTISPYSGPLYCHREDYSFSNSYAGRYLTLRVRSVIYTPGVEFHIDGIQVTDQ